MQILHYFCELNVLLYKLQLIVRKERTVAFDVLPKNSDQTHDFSQPKEKTINLINCRFCSLLNLIVVFTHQ